jgi:hypothetical protein
MGRRKISTTVYITPDQDEKLKVLSMRTGRPIAEYIREGIDLALKLHQKHLPQQLGLLGDLQRDPDDGGTRGD